jgi:cell wall-associated NlpC family hydrolase
VNWRRRCAAFVGAGLVTSIVTSVVAIGITGAASADPLADAKKQASQLQSQITKLQVKAEQASEKFDATEAALGQLVVDEQQAIDVAAATKAAAENDRTVVNSRARALYMSGGTLGLYASVLDGQDPDRLLSALHSVQAVSDADNRALNTMSSSAQTANAADARLAALRTRQGDLTEQAASASMDVANALAERQQALDSTNAQVLALEAELQAKIDADNAARAAQALELAQQLALADGLSGGNASDLALAAIAAARIQLGKQYVYGGAGPDTWDCSGLTQWAFRQAGVALPRTAAQQYAAVGTKIPLGELRPGDLLFWATDTNDPSTIHHVAIYIGGGMMLAAPHTGTVVQIEPVYLDGYIGAVRIG